MLVRRYYSTVHWLDKYCSKLDAKIDKVMGQYLI